MLKLDSILRSEIDPPGLCEFGNSLGRMGSRRRAKYRVFLYMKQGMLCHYCKCKMYITRIGHGERQPENLATFEHLIDDWSSTEGKDNSLSNIVLACFKCNNSRNSVRQSAAIRYYQAKFMDKKEWLDFSRRATPRVFIQRFGTF